MVIGAMSAHLSGSALWQKKRGPVPAQTAKGQSSIIMPVPKAVPENSVPKAIPVIETPMVNVPPESIPPSRGVTLSLPPGAGGLREQVAPETNPPKPPP